MMNVGIILAGGTGCRVGINIPKQYYIVNGKMLISKSIVAMEKCRAIDGYIIVAASQWHDEIISEIKDLKLNNKFLGFALPGESRQHSILSGMSFLEQKIKEQINYVAVHDAARPNITEDILDEYIANSVGYDGVMPALPMKDTIYYVNNDTVSELIDRDRVVAGQTPEIFDFAKFYNALHVLTDDELMNLRGSTEIAVKNGMRIRTILGDERNYKITTQGDLKRYIKEISQNEF